MQRVFCVNVRFTGPRGCNQNIIHAGLIRVLPGLPFARHRMDEAEPVGVQADTSRRIGRGPVLLVARDGGLHPLHMGADLVLLAGAQREFHQRVRLAFAQHRIGGDGLFAFARAGGPHLAVAVLAQQRVDHAGGPGQVPLDDGHVAAVIDQILPVALELFLHGLAFGVENQSRGLAVEPVDNEEAGRGMLLLDVLAEDEEGRAAALLVGADREETVPFVGHDEVIVLPDNAQQRVAQRAGRHAVQDGDRVAGLQGGIVAGGAAAVDGDASVGQERLDGGTAAFGHLFLQKSQQGIGFVYVEFH